MTNSVSLDRRLMAQAVKATPVQPENAARFVDAVGADIVSAMAAIDSAVINNARCIATFVEERRGQDMPLALGLDEMRLASDAVASSLKAREDTIRLKLALYRIPGQIGITSWGPWCPCEQPDKPLAGLTPDA